MAMHPAIADKKDELIELCRRFGVARLDLYGSAARGTDFDPETSDADFMVEFDPETDPQTLDHYFDFKNALSDALGRPVDLLEAGALRNRYLRQAIYESRELIYAM